MGQEPHPNSRQPTDTTTSLQSELPSWSSKVLPCKWGHHLPQHIDLQFRQSQVLLLRQAGLSHTGPSMAQGTASCPVSYFPATIPQHAFPAWPASAGLNCPLNCGFSTPTSHLPQLGHMAPLNSLALFLNSQLSNPHPERNAALDICYHTEHKMI